MNTFRRQFPLTPALSPREREVSRQSVGESKVLRTFNTRAWLFPLPEGEGKGEGEQDELQPFAPGISKGNPTPPSQVCPV